LWWASTTDQRKLHIWFVFQIVTMYNKKKIDIKFSAHDTFQEYAQSQNIFKAKYSISLSEKENQIKGPGWPNSDMVTYV